MGSRMERGGRTELRLLRRQPGCGPGRRVRRALLQLHSPRTALNTGSPGFGHTGSGGEGLVLWVQMSVSLFIVSRPLVLPLFDRSRGVCVGRPQARKEGRKGVKEGGGN